MIELLKEIFNKYKVLIFCIILIIFNISFFVINNYEHDEVKIERGTETLEEDEAWPDEILDKEEVQQESIQPQLISTKENADPYIKIPVYICGEVVNPGVYYVEQDAIIYDVLSLCGGATKSADINYLNLADTVKAHQKIYLPKVGEEIDKMIDSYENNNEASQKETKELSKLININTASVEALETLSGIGEVKAKAIIEYRTNVGTFQTIDDLLNVSGIGNKTFEKIKTYITV